jgi:plasmid stabilization system protein ParE
MGLNFNDIVWSPQAEQDLESILEYYLQASPAYAHKHILDILESAEKMVFSEQWQIDEYDPNSRRAIINRKFRVLYRVVEDIVIITHVYPTQKDPKGILKK